MDRGTRTFCYATDAVTGYYKVLVLGRAGEPYNIGDRGAGDLDATVGRADRRYRDGRDRVPGAGDSCACRRRPTTSSTTRAVGAPDISKAREQLAYEPAVDLRDGLIRSLLWYAENRVAATA